MSDLNMGWQVSYPEASDNSFKLFPIQLTEHRVIAVKKAHWIGRALNNV
jgi:hypothetical protein